MDDNAEIVKKAIETLEELSSKFDAESLPNIILISMLSIIKVTTERLAKLEEEVAKLKQPKKSTGSPYDLSKR